MRITVVLGVMLVLAGACNTQPERQPGVAAPVGDPSASSVPATPAPSSAGRPSAVVTSASPTQDRSASNSRAPKIRNTDWANASIRGLSFCGESHSVVRFRNGSNGLDIPCLMLPGGARPVYADFLTEEPANAPSTEDALVLVELGNPDAARQQALVPIQIGPDGRTLGAWPVIKGDEPSPAGNKVMTFTSYRVDDASNNVIARVKTLDGKTETRRYRQTDASGDWEQV